MKISGQQTLAFGEDELTLSQEGSLVNRTAAPASEREQQMTATSGRKCLEQFGRFPRAGSWQKTFAALLIGTGAWYSTRCRLTWKLRATKLSRFYFLLQVSELPTEGTGSGLSRTIILTNGAAAIVDAGDFDWLNQWSWKMHYKGYAYRTGRSKKEGTKWRAILMHRLITNARPGEEIDHINRDKLDNRKNNLRIVSKSVNMHNRDKPLGVSKAKGRNRWKAQIFVQNQRHYLGSYKTKEEALAARMEAEKKFGLLPTPELQNIRNGKNLRKDNNMMDGGMHGVSLHHLAAYGLLPTPSASDNRDRGGPSTPAVQRRMEIGKQVGLTMMVDGQLNPQFVQEMMGFPETWLTLPFQNGGKKV